MSWSKKITTCEICRKEMTNTLLKRHVQDQHKVVPKKYEEREELVKGNFCINFIKGTFNKCPVYNYSGGAKDKFGVYRHFCLIHLQADIVIKQDGELQKCNRCGMRVSNINKHMNSFT